MPWLGIPIIPCGPMGGLIGGPPLGMPMPMVLGAILCGGKKVCCFLYCAYFGSCALFSSSDMSSSGCINLEVKPELDSGLRMTGAPVMVALGEDEAWAGDEVTAAALGKVGFTGPAVDDDEATEDELAVDDDAADGKRGLAGTGGPGNRGPDPGPEVPGPPMPGPPPINGRGGIGPMPIPMGPIGPIGPMPGLMPIGPGPIGPMGPPGGMGGIGPPM